jgi:hypothetical protein
MMAHAIGGSPTSTRRDSCVGQRRSASRDHARLARLPPPRARAEAAEITAPEAQALRAQLASERWREWSGTPHLRVLLELVER